ncbi:MAG: FIST C-terminal domain-containing protein [Oscillospiraceae bacterium]|nr:FIST C-terminal domain-containing protein [Oscillospiraceae bacterium]
MIGKSPSGSVREAVSGLDGKPSIIFMYTDRENFADCVKALAGIYPDVPSLASPLTFYSKTMLEKGVGICAMYGVSAVSGAMRSVSTVPARDIASFRANIAEINAGENDTVCIDMCTGNDAAVMTTMYGLLSKSGISMTGGTAMPGEPVAVNGEIYTDACAYALIKNLTGRVMVYKENIYRIVSDSRFIASDTDHSRYYIGELNGRPAKLVYEDLCKVKDEDIHDSTFLNPFGKIVGRDVFIVSVSGTSGNGLTCYRQVNDSDVLALLELKDYHATVKKTAEKIKRDMSEISGIFSVNCILRQQLFEQRGYLQQYLDTMAIAPHAGFFGYGEHFNGQFVNQSMSCAVFE